MSEESTLRKAIHLAVMQPRSSRRTQVRRNNPSQWGAEADVRRPLEKLDGPVCAAPHTRQMSAFRSLPIELRALPPLQDVERTLSSSHQQGRRAARFVVRLMYLKPEGDD
jgi:hypothetical protein